MPVSRALRRLLRVLSIEEDQRRMALEFATGGLRQLERARAATVDQAQSGRQLVVSSVRSGELPDRLAGLEETLAARRRALVLAPRIADAEFDVDARRQEFLAKRVEARQAETLIQEAEARESIVAARRAQQSLDDWYLNRFNSAKTSADPSTPSENLSDDLPDPASQS